MGLLGRFVAIAVSFLAFQITTLHARMLGECPILVSQLAALPELTPAEKAIIINWNIQAAKDFRDDEISIETFLETLEIAKTRPNVLVRKVLNRSEDASQNPAAEFFYQIAFESPIAAKSKPAPENVLFVARTPSGDVAVTPELISAKEKEVAYLAKNKKLTAITAATSFVLVGPALWLLQSYGVPLNEGFHYARMGLTAIGVGATGFFLLTSHLLNSSRRLLEEMKSKISKTNPPTNPPATPSQPPGKVPPAQPTKPLFFEAPFGVAPVMAPISRFNANLPREMMTPERQVAQTLNPLVLGSQPKNFTSYFFRGKAARADSATWPKEWENLRSALFSAIVTIGPSAVPGATAVTLIVVPD
jgi:hypothetical protein